MKEKWSLAAALEDMHNNVQAKLNAARLLTSQPTVRGDCSEHIWIELLNNYLPKRYHTGRVQVCDSEGMISDQLDVVIYDQLYSSPILLLDGGKVVPAESVYAMFDAKQVITAATLADGKAKACNLRSLKRTSLPIPIGNNKTQDRQPFEIICGVLALESDWADPLGSTYEKHRGNANDGTLLNMVCVANSGLSYIEKGQSHTELTSKAVTLFILRLTGMLQQLGTVSMMDTRSYSRSLTDNQ